MGAFPREFFARGKFNLTPLHSSRGLHIFLPTKELAFETDSAPASASYAGYNKVGGSCLHSVTQGVVFTCWTENTSDCLMPWMMLQYDYCYDCCLSCVMMVQLLLAAAVALHEVFLLEVQVVCWH